MLKKVSRMQNEAYKCQLYNNFKSLESFLRKCIREIICILLNLTQFLLIKSYHFALLNVWVIISLRFIITNQYNDKNIRKSREIFDRQFDHDIKMLIFCATFKKYLYYEHNKNIKFIVFENHLFVKLQKYSMLSETSL